MTVFEALQAALAKASAYNKSDQMPPAAILWTDEKGEWGPAIARLRAAGLPLLTLGAYDPAARTGPAIWLRCMIARMLPGANWPAEATPILYLPGVSRQSVRAVEDCPRALQPIAELQYRGVLWTQKSGRDWTIHAFLQSEDGGLGIAVNGDRETGDAMRRALVKLLDEPVTSLRADAPLTAARFHALLNPEPQKNLLLWLNDPDGWKATASPEEWSAFRAVCRKSYGFDPEKDGPVTGGGLLGARQGVWISVWNRFAEAPHHYSHLPGLLRRARPKKSDGDLFHTPSSWPQDNDEAEEQVRASLVGLMGASADDARQFVRALEKTHAPRRNWVWAELGQSPLAGVLRSLAALADATETPLSGATPTGIATAYAAAGGWHADAAVLDSLAAVDGTDNVVAVKAAVSALYRPWLQTAAESFQQAVAHHPLAVPTAPAPKPGRCFLFADGLRMDAGQKLADALDTQGLAVKRDWAFAALPTVTATAKPAASPAAPRLGAGPELSPCVLSDGARVTADVLRRELTQEGCQILLGDETGTPPVGEDGGTAWTETGDIDAYGHAQGWKLARRVNEELQALAARIRGLLDAGWAEVCVVTDHGWLLLPGGLPKAELPEHLTETRKGRCARLKPSASTGVQVVPWRWDSEVRIAVAPGISCFTAGREYEHGGLSPQECVVPVLTVTAPQNGGPGNGAQVSVAAAKWKGFQCRIKVDGATSGMRVDIRTKAADPSTSLANAKPLGADGAATLFVEDDSCENQVVLVVVIGPGGAVLTQTPTTVAEG